MKRYSFILYVLIVMLLVSLANAQADHVDSNVMNYIRNEFYLAVEDENTAENLLEYLNNLPASDSRIRILAYTGALEAVMAKHVFNPYSKFKYVTRGLKKLDRAVISQPDALEIRFLRFAVLHNIPAIFGIGDERKADLNVVYTSLLSKDYSDLDYNLQKGIAEFLIKSDRLSSEQIVSLQNIFQEIKIQ